MKKIWIVAVAAAMASCNGVAGWFGKSDSTTVTKEDSSLARTDIPPRDYSITAANAYSDLFLDSNAIDRYLQNENITGQEEKLFRAFYEARNFQYAWIASDGLTDEARGFWNSYAGSQRDAEKKDGQKIKASLQERMDTLLQNDSSMINASDSSLVQTELALTRGLVQQAMSGNAPYVNTSNFYYLVPAKKRDPLKWADSILHRSNDTALYRGNTQYLALRKQLGIYHEAAKAGGWQPLTGAANLKKGAASPTVTALKKRLQLTGDFPAGDTGNIYSDTLVTTVKMLQARYGLAPTGTVNDSLLHALNVPVEERMSQIIINMNRSLWGGSAAATDSSHIEVDIPAQMLYVFEGKNKVMEMPVVVGKEGTNTVMFEGAINQVVFSPYWNIPASIVKNELLPKMKSDPGYLKKRNMEIVKQNDSIPEIRQLPGKENALGGVKFLFPNRYDIFLHDTPDKSLFAQKERALSHGCIRVGKPDSLAAYILRGDNQWTADKIREAMRSGKQQEVSVRRPVPVKILYLTARVDEKGALQFRNDVYGHDAKVRGKLFTQGG